MLFVAFVVICDRSICMPMCLVYKVFFVPPCLVHYQGALWPACRPRPWYFCIFVRPWLQTRSGSWAPRSRRVDEGGVGVCVCVRMFVCVCVGVGVGGGCDLVGFCLCCCVVSGVSLSRPQALGLAGASACPSGGADTQF